MNGRKYYSGTVPPHNTAVLLYNACVTETLLQTKLYIPPLRPNLVPRPRLFDQLNRGLDEDKNLILISAPSGFGKTTLVSEWVAACRRPPAWLSLDEGDNEIPRLKFSKLCSWDHSFQ